MWSRLASYGAALALLAGSGAAEASSAAAARAGASCARGRAEDTVAAVLPRGDIALASGRTIRLLDIRLPAPGEGALTALRALAGRRVAVLALASGADRWGREAADLAPLDEPDTDVAGRLVTEGLALVDAGERGALCRTDLLADEGRARARRIGLWAGDRHGPVGAEDLAGLRARLGGFTLVEGRVRGVGERRARTYLNFGADWTQDMTVTIPARTWAALKARGVTAATLKGRRIRARGVLEEWQGVAMEIVAADMLEVLGQELTRP